MTTLALPFGTQIADLERESSEICAPIVRSLKTLRDLQDIWATDPPAQIAMLRSTCNILACYLENPIEQITIDSVNDARSRFRAFLESRKYAENSIRTYVNHLSILLKSASRLGWNASNAVPTEWHGVQALAAGRKCEDLVRHFVLMGKSPSKVTIEDVDTWARERFEQGVSMGHLQHKKSSFWHLLQECGCTKQTPPCLRERRLIGVPIDKFPEGLKSEVLELLQWKQVAFAVDRPKGGRHRPVTSKRLQEVICALYGYAVNVRRDSGISSLASLVQKEMISGYMEWSINVRKVKTYGLQCSFRLLAAAMRQHPKYTSIDFTWFKPLIDSLPIEPKSELKKRKALKYLDYAVLESIPVKIHAKRLAAPKGGHHKIAMLGMEEFLMRWLITLPWRQRNLRECRIAGQAPNLFKGKIPLFSDIDKPDWVKEEEHRNPDAEFWQFHFGSDETKTKIDVHAVLPRMLVGPLEEYLEKFRPQLIQGADPGTLFINHRGTAFSMEILSKAVSSLTLRYGGRRVTPHLYRDIFAFTWLKDHPKDYLTLSKILWHSNVNTTIGTYGSRFNESSGVCAIETWLETREHTQK